MIMMIFGGCIPPCLLKFARYGNYFLRFFPLMGGFYMLGRIFSLMRKMLHVHACQESGRNSVQAGDSLSMRESWKPWFSIGLVVYNI